MDQTAQKDKSNFITLRQAAELLNVNVETLLEWNDNNILKPTISQEGVIGYTQSQLQKFISIQNSFQDTYKQKFTKKQETPSNISNKVINNKPDEDGTDPISPDTKSQIDSDINKAKLISISFASALIVISTSLAYSTVLGHISIDNAASQNQNLTNLDSTALKQNSITDNSNLRDENITDPYDRSSETLFDKESSIAANLKNNNNNDRSPQILAARTNSNQRTDRSNTYLDQNGNLRITRNDPLSLASQLGSSTMSQTAGIFGRNINIGIIAVSLSLGLLWAVYAYRQQPSYSTINANGTFSLNQKIAKVPADKTLEVNQKTDGTVFIRYKDQEFKVSKPELNSETDRLIQKLLTIIDDEQKELEYDILQDEYLTLNSPLSKVVTRLGFVGTKRDLFFPRTSKNKVVFRKYLTQSDLKKLHLNEEDIKKELSS